MYSFIMIIYVVISLFDLLQNLAKVNLLHTKNDYKCCFIYIYVRRSFNIISNCII